MMELTQGLIGPKLNLMKGHGVKGLELLVMVTLQVLIRI